MEIKNKLEEIFREVLDLEDLILEDTTSADDVEEWDSLAHINLVVEIEREYDIRFALGELEELNNIADMVLLITKKINE